MPLRLKIDTGRRVFEHKGGSPRITRTLAISTLLKEGQFGFQQFEDVAVVLHENVPRILISWPEREGRD
jgi:hypothetical protein